MSTHNPASFAPDPDSPDAWERALLDRQLARLERLADMGMDMASDIHRRATTADESAPLSDLQHAAIDFARVSRAVRLTLALQSKLIADFKAPPRAAKGSAAEAAEDDADFDPKDVMWLGGREVNEPMRRAHVRNSVCDAGRHAGLDREAVDQLRLEAVERLERDDYGDIMNRPLREILAEIHRDLGLKPNWEPRDQDLWFREEIGSGARRWPFSSSITASTSPIAEAMAGGGPPADPGAMPGEERGVEGEGGRQSAAASPLRESS